VRKLTSSLAFLPVVALVAATAAAALSPQLADFGKGPAQWIMTKEEQAKWKTINDDAAAQAFIDLFWARRDPTPGTPQNEYREQFEQRVAAADKSFPQASVRGAMTDRGHVFIILGNPTRLDRTDPASKGKILGPDDALNRTQNIGATDRNVESLQAYSPKQLWIYDASKTKAKLDAPFAEIAFIDQYGSNEWKLERTSRTDLVGLLARNVSAAIVQPNLTEAPKYNVAAAAAPVAAAAAQPLLAFKTDAYRAAVDELRAGKAPEKKLYLAYGSFVTPQGEAFVPVELYAPRSAGLSAQQQLTFFGMIEDAEGKPAAVFEEPATLIASKNDYFFDKSIKLAPGRYKATFGLAEGGKPLSMVRSDLDVAAVDKDASSLSPLILSNNVYTMTERQKPTDPFAFGGMKVVPKADLTFSNADELWYFFEARNPGVDTGTGLPKMEGRLTISGTTAEGKKVRMDGGNEPLDVQPLKGMSGRYAAGASIPLARFKPGSYALKMKVTDAVKNQTYDLEQSFTITGEN
jgi:GWxTD domain-containing protein